MNLRVPWNAGNFLTSCKPVSFSRTLHHGVSKAKMSGSPWRPLTETKFRRFHLPRLCALRLLWNQTSNIFNSSFVKDYFSPCNMIGTLGSGTPIVPSESRVEVEHNGDVDSELNSTSDDSEVSQPSPGTLPETQWHHNSLRFLASNRLPAVSSRLISRFDEGGVEFFPGFRMEIKRPCFHAFYCMWKTALNTLVREV